MKQILIFTLFSMVTGAGYGQFLMDLDTSTTPGLRLLNQSGQNGFLKLGGYIQPQFQWATQKGTQTVEGGNFAPGVSNRFMLRRSRVKLDYIRVPGKGPAVQFVFQFDANERSFSVRDVWGRIFNNESRQLSLTAGMFARPFGYEINLSSSERESPERGRMSQVLMKGERDLGIMGTLDLQNHSGAWKLFKADLGLFNGEGITASGDFDNHKDLIGRLALKPQKISTTMEWSGGLSVLYGGLQHNTPYIYKTIATPALTYVSVDSSTRNKGSISPRNYYGADAQLKISSGLGSTIVRAEYIMGMQTGTALSSETPTALLNGYDGFYQRNFSGGYFYFVQQLKKSNHQLLIKYDWYDPNTKVSEKGVGAARGFSLADLKYSTLGAGYIYTINANAKFLCYYAHPVNELTSLLDFKKDINDDVLTLRLQFRF